MRYDEYMQSSIWRKKRKDRLVLDQHSCRLCDSGDELEVHHRPTSYKRIPNESVEDDLITLCRTCHELITDRIRRRRFGNSTTPQISVRIPLPLSQLLSPPSVTPTAMSLLALMTERPNAHVLEIPELEVCRRASPPNA